MIHNGNHINPVLRPQVFEEKDVLKQKMILKKKLIQSQIVIAPRLDSLTPFIRYTEALKMQKSQENQEVQEDFLLNKQNSKGPKPISPAITIEEGPSLRDFSNFFRRKNKVNTNPLNPLQPLRSLKPTNKFRKEKVSNSLHALEISELSDLSDEESEKSFQNVPKPQLQFGARKADSRMRKKSFRKKGVIPVYDSTQNFMIVLSDEEDGGLDWKKELRRSVY